METASIASFMDLPRDRSWTTSRWRGVSRPKVAAAPKSKTGAPQGTTGLRTSNRVNLAFKAKGEAIKPDRKLQRFIVALSAI